MHDCCKIISKKQIIWWCEFHFSCFKNVLPDAFSMIVLQLSILQVQSITTEYPSIVHVDCDCGATKNWPKQDPGPELTLSWLSSIYTTSHSLCRDYLLYLTHYSCGLEGSWHWIITDWWSLGWCSQTSFNQ